MELRDLDEKLYPNAMRRVLVSFYTAHQPGSDPNMTFRRMSINGVDVDRDTLDTHRELPGKQGWFIVLGEFNEGEKLDFDWLLETRNVGNTSRLALGIFRDGRLTQRTVFTSLVLDSFKQYPGTGSAII